MITASLTGETKPNELVKGDPVLSGAINGNSSIQIETTVIAAESQFQKIVELVKETEKLQLSLYVWLIVMLFLLQLLPILLQQLLTLLLVTLCGLRKS